MIRFSLFFVTQSLYIVFELIDVLIYSAAQLQECLTNWLTYFPNTNYNNAWVVQYTMK